MRKIVPELVEVTKRHLAERAASKEMGTGRIDIVHYEQKSFEATVKSGDKELKFWIDEPEERGGLCRGPHPLGYFLAGAAG
jgi:hypothetical protein